MVYSDFTLNDIKRQFHCIIDETTDVFASIGEVEGSTWLQETLRETLPLALAVHTEKSRSELLIAPILVELRKLARHQVSLFSGIDFSVAPSQGLNGVCDFIVSQSPEQLVVSAPVLIIVEAKNENIKGGLAQCIAAMVAARLFNDREGSGVEAVYGAVTTGTNWHQLALPQARIRRCVYRPARVLHRQGREDSGHFSVHHWCRRSCGCPSAGPGQGRSAREGQDSATFALPRASR